MIETNATDPVTTTAPGTYVLLLRCEERFAAEVGRLGTIDFLPGWYLYAGSARGPGGIAARLNRHLRHEKKRHWHIDHLTTTLPVVEVWYREGAEREECAWASALTGLPGTRPPIVGFGASDCRCVTHLVGMHRRPHVSQFSLMLAGEVAR